MSKGSTPRPMHVSREQWEEHYALAFGKPAAIDEETLKQITEAQDGNWIIIKEEDDEPA